MRRGSLVLGISLWLLSLPASAEPLSRVQVDPGRARSLTTTAGKLGGLPAYVTLYSGTHKAKVNGRPVTQNYQGATVVCTLDGACKRTWLDRVGKSSVGFGTNAGLDGKHGTSFVRIRGRLFHWRSLRGESNEGRPWVPVPIADKSSPYVEATFTDVSSRELDALETFYLARHHLQIKDESGRGIVPSQATAGGGTLRTEGCAGACTSSSNEQWLEAFRRNVASIKAFGQRRNIPELARASEAMIADLRAFTGRNKIQVHAGPKAMVKDFFTGKAPLLSVFNTGAGNNPKDTMRWGGSWRNGLSMPTALFDAPLGEAPAKGTAIRVQRLPLSDLAGALR